MKRKKSDVENKKILESKNGERRKVKYNENKRKR